MSFWPFPKTLSDEFNRFHRKGLALELGAGEGRLARRLIEFGFDVVTVDLVATTLRSVPRAVAADLRQLPFPDLSCGSLFFADVLRHLDPAARRLASSQASRCVRNEGRVVVFEDSPTYRNEAEQNYRRCLDLLAITDPRRGTAVGIDKVCGELEATFGPARCSGQATNETIVEDPLAPIAWLRDHAPSDCHAELLGLQRSILDHGVAYGEYEYRVFVK